MPLARRDRIRPWIGENRPKSTKIGRNWPKSGKFGPNMRVTMENPAKYSTEALTHECFSSHISTLLSTVSGTPINNQQQQVVEFKATFLVILTRDTWRHRRDIAATRRDSPRPIGDPSANPRDPLATWRDAHATAGHPHQLATCCTLAFRWSGKTHFVRSHMIWSHGVSSHCGGDLWPQYGRFPTGVSPLRRAPPPCRASCR